MLLPDESVMLPVEDIPVDGSLPNFNGDDLAAAIKRDCPYLFLRYSDGEFISMLGNNLSRRNRNADGSNYRRDTLGQDLRDSFEGAFAEIETGSPIVVELTESWVEWSGMRDAVQAMTPTQRASVTVGPVLTRMITDGSVFTLLDALRQSKRPKLWVSKPEDAEVAESIGATLIKCPTPDAYLHLDALVEHIGTARQGPAIILSSIGMASEPLLWRLWDSQHTLMDLGHIPDALLGRKRRRYLRRGGQAKRINQKFNDWRDSR